MTKLKRKCITITMLLAILPCESFAHVSAFNSDDPPSLQTDSVYLQIKTDSVKNDALNRSDSTTFNPVDFYINSPDFKLKQYLLVDTLQDSFHIGSSNGAMQTIHFKLLPFYNNYEGPAYRQDFAEKEINRRNLGQESLFSVSDLLAKGIKYLQNKFKDKGPLRIKGIPSKVQLAALNVLWQKPLANGNEIYAEMDTAIHATAEILNSALADLWLSGVVERQMISPKNEFTVFGVANIEMSSMNRKNRNYAYKARISRDEFIKFLDGALYNAKKELHAASSIQKDLQEKLNILAKGTNSNNGVPEEEKK